MIDCPNCRNPMQSRSADVHGAIPHLAPVSSCTSCNLFWFSDSTSIGLTPQAVLALFQFIGNAGAARTSLGTAFTCPDCRRSLQFTHDLARTMRFTYWRCATDHGQLITFGQFLAEKNMIRAPSAGELAQLRATLRQVSCSQCGGPIDLVTDSACPHCGAAVALIDPEGVANALRELQQGATSMPAQSQDNARTSISNAQIDALFSAQRMYADGDGNRDLIAIGAAAIGAVLGSLLS